MNNQDDIESICLKNSANIDDDNDNLSENINEITDQSIKNIQNTIQKSSKYSINHDHTTLNQYKNECINSNTNNNIFYIRPIIEENTNNYELNNNDRSINSGHIFICQDLNIFCLAKIKTYIRQPILTIYKNLVYVISILINSTMVTFLLFQCILFFCRIFNILSQKGMLLVIFFIGLLYFISIFYRCCRNFQRVTRRSNRNTPLFLVRRGTNISHLLNMTRTERERSEFTRRIIFNEIRLNQLRTQLQLNFTQPEGDYSSDPSPVDDDSSSIFDYIDLVRETLDTNHLLREQRNTSRLTQNQINNLHKEKYTSKTKITEGDYEECTICLEDFIDGDEIRIFSCSHKFHLKCIDNWLLVKNICPNCKYIIQELVDGKYSQRF